MSRIFSRPVWSKFCLKEFLFIYLFIFLYLFIFTLRSVWYWGLQTLLSITKLSTKLYSTLFMYLLYEYPKRCPTGLQPVIQLAVQCRPTKMPFGPNSCRLKQPCFSEGAHWRQLMNMIGRCGLVSNDFDHFYDQLLLSDSVQRSTCDTESAIVTNRTHVHLTILTDKKKWSFRNLRSHAVSSETLKFPCEGNPRQIGDDCLHFVTGSVSQYCANIHARCAWCARAVKVCAEGA